MRDKKTRFDTPESAARGAAIGFGGVRHTRLRPRRHAFGYAVYFFRLPVRNLDVALAGYRWLSYNRWNLMSFHSRDHGPRDGSPILPWIETLLHNEGIRDASGEIWLHAFPRVLGYVFNPISFWYCHRQDGALRAVVCEVCNTFGENHCYLLAHDDGRPLRDGEEMAARKEFHVSPFLKIEGGYRFRFILARGRSVACVDYDDASGPLLLTSIYGSFSKLSDRLLLRAFFSYPLFTLSVVVRIHWQAAKLWAKRIPFVSKPAPPPIKVSR